MTTRTTILHRLAIFGLILCLGPKPAYAVRQVRTLYSDTAITADANGSKVCLPSGAYGISFSLDADHNSGSSTLDVKVQYTIDEGTTWLDCSSSECAFTQVTTSDSNQAIHISKSARNLEAFCLRAVVDVGASGSPNYDATVRVHFLRD